MKFFRKPSLGLILFFPWAVAAAFDADGNWPSFRGPAARGVAESHALPTEWDVKSGKNILWKTPIDGLGHSSPVVWGDRVFVTTAVSGVRDPELKVGLYGAIEPVRDDSVHTWKVYCLDKKTGKVLWERVARQAVPRIRRHPKATHANSTPATDGKHLVVFFGSEGLFCYDLEGNLRWSKDLGVLDSGFFRYPSAQWGFASSPVIHDGKVIVQCDVQKDSFLAAFDIKTGVQLWRTPRRDVPTWSTPAVVEAEGRPQVVVNGFRHIGGYDLKTGRELWRLAGGGDIPVPTPIEAGGLIYITNAHGPMAPIYAIRADAVGDVSLKDGETANQGVAWSVAGRNGAYMQTPIIVGDYLYVCRDNGTLSAYHARTGERVYRQRLGNGGGFTASAVSDGRHLYYAGEEGDVYVVKAGPEFQETAVNSMGEICMATPAISEGMLLFRTRSHVVAVGH